MAARIPYLTNMEIREGAFVTLKNKIIIVKDNHDKTATRICREALTSEESELFSLWKESNKALENDRATDFLVFVLGYDKIEKPINHSIVTVDNNPYIKYYNYCLMDWQILPQRRIVYNPETKKFESHFSQYIEAIENIDAKQEIEDVKKSVLIKDRHYFFKD